MMEAYDDATEWFQANGFTLNRNKTQSLLLSLRQESENCNVKFLGIYVDKRLTWEPHVDSLCTRLSRVIYLLRRLKFLVPSAFLKNAYYAFFHGVIVYGINIWGNCNSISKILVLQKKAVRILTGSVFDAHCKPLFTNEGILTVINLYIYIYMFIENKKELK